MVDVPKRLHRGFAGDVAVHDVANTLEIGGVVVRHLDDGAAAEIDAEIEAAGGEEEHCEHERDGRDHVERERVPHERDVAVDAEEFHVRGLSCDFGERRRSVDDVGAAGACPPGHLTAFAGVTAAAGCHTWPIEIFARCLRLP